MIIDTKYLGPVEIDEKDIVVFEEGLLGLEDFKRYTLLGIGDGAVYKCLQPVNCKDFAFIVVSPWDVAPDYEIDVDDAEISAIGERDMSSLDVYAILTIKPEGVTANLIGPVIINTKTMKGRQVVLVDSRYTTRNRILKLGQRV